MAAVEEEFQAEKLIRKMRSLRELHGYTQQEVAQQLHVERSTYTWYELGRVIPKIDTLVRLGLPLRRFGRLPARYRQGVDGQRTGISSFSIFQTVFPGNGETAFVCQTMKNHVSRQGGSTPNWWTEGRFILTPP